METVILYAFSLVLLNMSKAECSVRPDGSQRRRHLGGEGSIVIAENIDIPARYDAALFHLRIERINKKILNPESCVQNFIET